MFKRLIISLDSLSYTPQLYTKGQMRHFMLLGGIFQLVVYILSLSGMLYFAQDVYLRVNPRVIESSIIDADPAKLILKKTDFTFFYSINDPITYKPYIDESIYKAEFYQNEIINGTLVTNKLLRTEPCNLNRHFYGLDTSVIPIGTPLDQFYCIHPDEEIFLQGTMNSAHWSYIQIRIKSCDQTKSKHCVSTSTQDSKLKGFSSMFWFINKYFDANDYKNPTRYFLQSSLIPLSNKLFNALIYPLKKNIFNDDVGFLFESLSERTEILFDDIGSSRLFDYREVGHFVEILVTFNSRNVVTNRFYKRFQTVIAEVGGLIGIIKMLIGLIIQNFSTKNYFDTLIDSDFTDINHNKIKRIMLSTQTRSEIFVIGDLKNNIKDQEEGDMNSNSNNKPIKNNLVNSPQQKIKLKKSKIIRNLPKSEKIKLLKSQIDIRTIIKTVKQLNLLKVILLEKENINKYDAIISNKSSGYFIVDSFVQDMARMIISNTDKSISQKLDLIKDFFSN